ncbi:helix-turn-helix transcriptional regulator [Candidatus Shapirobacteria bacterium]|nr:helix-turn-helix transcriptional regulator [Candidatus Shapirobacteria bacterium]
METNFGNALKKARMARKITIREVSDYISKSIGYISDVEHDRKQPPDLETVRKMEEFLGVKEGMLVNLAAKARKKMPFNLTQRLKARPLLSEVLLRADNLTDEEIKKVIDQLAEAEKEEG